MMMRTVHRLCSILALLVMLYLGVTGSIMQVIDLNAILSHAPETDATMTSINEGKEGNGDFAVRSVHDLGANPLPGPFDVVAALEKALPAFHAAQPHSEIRFAEVRMAGDRPIVQIATSRITGYPEFAQSLASYDAQSGRPVASLHVSPAQPLPSLRETLKEWHRFFTRSFAGGTYLALISGVVLWVMIVTGLAFYIQLLRKRRQSGFKQLFWKSGGWWRSIHRWISLLSAVILMALAFTGSWIGLESSWHNFRADPGPDFSSPMTDGQVIGQARRTLDIFRAAEPSTPIKVLRVRTYSGYPQGVVITGGNLMIDGETTRQLVYNTNTSNVMSLTERGYPPNQFVFGLQAHENAKHLHDGFMLGTWSRFFYLFGGLSLIYLSVSGLVMYWRLWRVRRQLGRPSPIWIKNAVGKRPGAKVVKPASRQPTR